MQSTDLLAGVNALVNIGQDDPRITELREQASASDSKLKALLEQVCYAAYINHVKNYVSPESHCVHCCACYVSMLRPHLNHLKSGCCT